jgi:hypothetical protein
MARSVTQVSAIEIVEEAIHLLRTAGAPALALAWCGAIPFSLGVLLFWRDMTNYRRGIALCASEAFLLVILLFWMNVWRGMFAAKVHAQLAGASPAKRSGFLRHLGVHLLLGNCKLLVIPLATLLVFLCLVRSPSSGWRLQSPP